MKLSIFTIQVPVDCRLTFSGDGLDAFWLDVLFSESLAKRIALLRRKCFKQSFIHF